MQLFLQPVGAPQVVIRLCNQLRLCLLACSEVLRVLPQCIFGMFDIQCGIILWEGDPASVSVPAPHFSWRHGMSQCVPGLEPHLPIPLHGTGRCTIWHSGRILLHMRQSILCHLQTRAGWRHAALPRSTRKTL